VTVDAGVSAPRRRLAELEDMVFELGAQARAQALGGARYLATIPVDLTIALAIGVVVSALALVIFAIVPFVNVVAPAGGLWFDGDVLRIINESHDRFSHFHARTNVHPLISLLTATPGVLIGKLGVSRGAFAGLFVGTGSFVFGSLFYAALRTTGVPRLESGLGVVLATVSAAGMFWLGCPETMPLGSSTMLVSLIWLGRRRGEHDAWSAPLQGALSLAITASNWMAGLAATFLGLGARRGLQAAVLGFAIVAALTPLQSLIFPYAGQFLGLFSEFEFVDKPSSALSHVSALLFHGLVAPAPHVISGVAPDSGPWRQLSFQTAVPAHDLLAIAAFTGWAALLALGARAAITRRVRPDLAVFTALVFAGQYLLHMVYGEETFLYSLDYTPWIILAAAWASLVNRPLAIALMALTAAASFLHNFSELRTAVELVNA
jgi:hypothetical protein